MLKYERLQKLGKDVETIDSQVSKAMTEYAPHIIEVLEARLNLLALVGSTAPLWGMLGTVTGMISAFASIGQSGSLEGAAVAKGIAEALITTAFGLFIAIPAVFMHNLFSRQVEKFVLEIEEAATKLVDFVTTGAE